MKELDGNFVIIEKNLKCFVTWCFLQAVRAIYVYIFEHQVIRWLNIVKTSNYLKTHP